MSYLEFLLLFVGIPILGLSLVQRPPIAGVGARRAGAALAGIAAIALAYTTPWDNYLVYRGVWTYGADRVVGTIGYVPTEEYLFFLLQPALTGLFFFALRSRISPDSRGPKGLRASVSVAWVSVSVIGVVLLLHPSQRFLYLGLILSWATLPLAGMAWLGAERLWQERRAVGWGIAIPTLYLWLADRTAIRLGIWDIADRYSLGLDPFGLPVEEAVFFLLTNVLSVSGLALFLPERRSPPLLSRDDS